MNHHSAPCSATAGGRPGRFAIATAGLLSLLLGASLTGAESIYDFELLGDGAVIARADGFNNTNFPSVIRVPDWIPSAERADPNANYYLYYSTHSARHIRLKWAASLDGPWTDFDLGGTFNGQDRRGVFDVDADPTREDYDHLSAPDVIVDDANQRLIMFYHGRNQPTETTSGGTQARQRHESFVATSSTGLNFNDPLHAGGETNHGPRTVTVDDVTRDVWIGEDYQQVFQKEGRYYSVAKRGILNAAPATGDPFAALASDPFGEAWEREDTSTDLWTNDASTVQDDYHSPGTTFLASSEFANHPNNPNPGVRITSNGNSERLNHVSVNVLPGDELEVFFYVRDDPSDRYDGIYRIVYDTSDPDFQAWDVKRDDQGQALFDVVLTPEQVTAAVQAANPGADATFYADPVSLGDTDIFVDDDGSKYLFFSYVSAVFGGQQGEGQITGVQLFDPLDGDFNRDGLVDAADFTVWRDGFGAGYTESDYTVWKNNFGATRFPPSATSVPEPGTLASVLLGLAVVGRRREKWTALARINRLATPASRWGFDPRR